MKKATTWEGSIEIGPLLIGWTLFSYQIAFGFSIQYVPAFEGRLFRIYFGPLKIWGNIKKSKKHFFRVR